MLPQTSKQAIKRVEIQLSDKKCSVGSNAVCEIKEEEDGEMY